MSYKLKELCLEVTNACTMECLHCSTCSVKYGAETSVHMPLLAVKNIISDFVKLGGKILEISGGEPLTYPYLDDLCDYAKSLDLEIMLYTSGVQWRDNEIQELTLQRIQELGNNGVNKIIFNLEGAKPETHQEITNVKGSYHLVIKGIQNTKEAGLWTGIHFVPMKINNKELPKVVELCSRLRIDELAVLRFVPQGRGKENQSILELSDKEFKKLLRRIISLKKLYPDLNIRAGCPMDFLSLFDKQIKAHKCKAGISTCSIAPNGDVFPCPGFKNSTEVIAGNIYQKPLSLIWESAFQFLRDFDYNYLKGSCQNCEHLDSCLGRCAAQRHIAYGNIYIGPDPACPKRIKDVADLRKQDMFLPAAHFNQDVQL